MGVGEISLREHVVRSSEEPWKVEGDPAKRIELPKSWGSSMVVSKECKGGTNAEILSSKETRVTWGRFWGWLILQLKTVT